MAKAFSACLSPSTPVKSKIRVYLGVVKPNQDRIKKRPDQIKPMYPQCGGGVVGVNGFSKCASGSVPGKMGMGELITRPRAVHAAKWSPNFHLAL